jgi:(p)ppGpp synthase/HD superfamily hydrolase
MRNSEINTAVTKAVEIIEVAFKGKKDKAGSDYVNHLYRVANKVNGSKEYVVALLHDLLEDCPEWTPERLREHDFSESVIQAVICLTKVKGESYENYLNRVASNELAVKIKIADLEDNMDITRLPYLTELDFVRLQKYLKAWHKLKSIN